MFNEKCNGFGSAVSAIHYGDLLWSPKTTPNLLSFHLFEFVLNVLHGHVDIETYTLSDS